MKKSLFLLLILLLTGCATFQVSTLNHDQVRVVNNEFELQHLLRTDFNFRFDYAQYALRQPRSFDWNNRLLGNRYNFYNPYYSRVLMWNDWVWGNNYLMPYRWFPFGYDRWGYNNYYGWNNYGWNWYNRGYNIPGNKNRGRNSSQINGRKSNIKTSRRIVTTTTTPRNTIIKVKPRTRVNYSRTRVNSSYRRNSTVRSTPNRSTRSTNNTSTRFNSRKKN